MLSMSYRRVLTSCRRIRVSAERHVRAHVSVIIFLLLSTLLLPLGVYTYLHRSKCCCCGDRVAAPSVPPILYTLLADNHNKFSNDSDDSDDDVILMRETPNRQGGVGAANGHARNGVH
jgi:hypothetical protein